MKNHRHITLPLITLVTLMGCCCSNGAYISCPTTVESASEHVSISQKDMKKMEMAGYSASAKQISEGQHLSVQDIIDMNDARICDSAIIHAIKRNGILFSVDQYTIDELCESGVGYKITDYLTRNYYRPCKPSEEPTPKKLKKSK